jgi:P-type Ca2+ transporter type 2C
VLQVTAKTGQATFTGLSRFEAEKRSAHYSLNALPELRPDPLWLRFLRQFQRPLIFILLFALLFDVGVWLFEGRYALP